MAETGLTDVEAGVDLDARKSVVNPIKPLLGSTARAGRHRRRSRTPRS
jgi:chromosome condensin MukBEF MukE localization factor